MVKSTLRDMILALIIFMLLLMMFNYQRVMSYFMTDEQLCRVTAIGADKVRLAGKNLMIADCKSRLVQVFPDKVLIDGRPGRVYLEGKSVYNYHREFEDHKEEIISDILSQELFRCFDMLEGGTINPFANRPFDTDHAGILCSRISFSPEIEEEIRLFEYMEETKLPLRQETYAEILLGAVEVGETSKPIFSFSSIKFNKINDRDIDLESGFSYRDYETGRTITTQQVSPIIPFVVMDEDCEENKVGETITSKEHLNILTNDDYYVMMTFISPKYRAPIFRWVYAIFEGRSAFLKQAKDYYIYGYLTLIPVESAANLEGLLN